MKKNKKSQFLILSIAFLILLLIITYSIETPNYYIQKNSEYFILNNIVSETCVIGLNSNGSNLENRYLNYTMDIKNYCEELNYVCNLTIVNNTIIPTNETLINYTLFDYNVYFKSEGYFLEKEFTC